jgi:uncharacterized membrane protein YhdT
MEKVTQKFVSMVKIVLIHSQIFGLMPFGFDETNFHPSRWNFSYTLLVLVLYLLFSIYSLRVVPNIVGLPSIFTASTIMAMIADLVYMLCCFVCCLVKREKLVQFLQKIMEFDINLQTNCIIVDYQKTKNKMLLRLVVRHSRFLVLGVCGCYLSPWKNLPIDRFFELYEPVLVLFNTAFCFQVTELVLILKARFVILNKQLSNLVDFFTLHSINTLSAQRIVRKKSSSFIKICALHHLLSKSIKLFNRIFGLPLLLMFGVGFMMTVICLFFITVELQSPEIFWAHILYTALPCINIIIDTLYICDVCYSTIEEVVTSRLV